jgi:hypothetical protein
VIDPNDPNYKPRPPRDYRKLGIGLCIASIVLFVYAAFSHRWLENTQFSNSRVGFSLIAFEACAGEKCETASNFQLIRDLTKNAGRHEEKPSTMFAPVGVVTMALSLLSVLALGAIAFVAFKRQQLTFKVLPSTIALLSIMTALITGCMFLAKKPGGYNAVGVGPSFWAFAIACVAGIVGAQMLHKMIKPPDPDLNPI